MLCAKFIKGHQRDPLEAKAEAGQKAPGGWWTRFNSGFNRKFTSFLDGFDRVQGSDHPVGGQVKQVEDLVRRLVEPHDLRLIVSNIGSTPGFSSIYTSNSASHSDSRFL
jgi:hypothetical protein